MKQIQTTVPEGKMLIVSGLKFVGPCTARATVHDNAAEQLVDTPAIKPLPTKEQITAKLAKLDLSRSDTQLARVVEDLITLLVTKGMIHLVELPEAAQTKLATRAEARAKL